MKLNHEMLNAWFVQLPLGQKRQICNIVHELQSAIKKHPNWPHDHIHAAAVVAEEAGELVRAAINHVYEDAPFYDMHKEAIQTGATAVRFLLETGSLHERIRQSL